MKTRISFFPIYPFTIMGVLLMLLFELTTTAQDYNIKFGATGVTVVKVDSVLVENINQGFKLTLPGNETLHLGALGLENSGINCQVVILCKDKR
jgi:hypothetical protein